MVTKNTKSDKLLQGKKFAKGDTSYSSFWLYNRERDINSEHFRDSFVNFYDDKELLSEFNPTTAKNIISFWSEKGDIILDPFSGRTRALVSYAMDRKYVGYDISKDAVNYIQTKLDRFNISNNEVKIINKDCKYIKEDIKDESVDMVFSCPPYWNLEKYESVNGQLSDINSYQEFLLSLYNRLYNASKKLKEDGYMVLVVGDFRKRGEYIPFHSDLMTFMYDNENLKLHDVITIQNIPFHTAAFYFGNSKKYKFTAKSHEYILVWKKIKP